MSTSRLNYFAVARVYGNRHSDHLTSQRRPVVAAAPGSNAAILAAGVAITWGLRGSRLGSSGKRWGVLAITGGVATVGASVDAGRAAAAAGSRAGAAALIPWRS
jgi:hypothetical protein